MIKATPWVVRKHLGDNSNNLFKKSFPGDYKALFQARSQIILVRAYMSVSLHFMFAAPQQHTHTRTHTHTVLHTLLDIFRASLVAQRLKHLPAMRETWVWSLGLIPGSARSPEGNGNPLQYSCLENPMDGGVWWATVHEVATKFRCFIKIFLCIILHYMLYKFIFF